MERRRRRTAQHTSAKDVSSSAHPASADDLRAYHKAAKPPDISGEPDALDLPEDDGVQRPLGKAKRLEIVRESGAPQLPHYLRNLRASSPGDNKNKPVQSFDGQAMNPDPPRRWPLFLAMGLTAVLVLVVLNFDERSRDATHWAAPQSTGIAQRMVEQPITEGILALPTRVPDSYFEELAANALAEIQPTPTPAMTIAPVTNTPSPTKVPLLKKGIQGSNTTKLQQRLVELGYLDAEEVNGKFESSTQKAVKAFQEENHLRPADGMAGKDTLEAIYRSDAIAAPTPTPEPTRKDEPYVWVTKNGTYYHADETCSNMKGAYEVALSDAKGKYRVCGKCDPPK